jgi:uncharacterized repeat protein (TIGR03803 family)
MPLQAESFSAWIVENRIIPVREGDAYGLGDDAPHVRQRCRQVLSLLATYRGYEWHLLGTTQAQIADSTACSLTSSGTFTTLHMFTGPAECHGLVEGTDGNFYGSSQSGGASNLGVVFKMTSAGGVTVLHSFPGSIEQWATGIWFKLRTETSGVTLNGGTNGAGVIFKITSTGTYTLLYNFPNTGNLSTGTFPYSSLIQAPNGLLYGLTGNVGGPWAFCSIYSFKAAARFPSVLNCAEDSQSSCWISDLVRIKLSSARSKVGR